MIRNRYESPPHSNPQELQLRGNEMGDKGVKAICDALKVAGKTMDML